MSTEGDVETLTIEGRSYRVYGPARVVFTPEGPVALGPLPVEPASPAAPENAPAVPESAPENAP